MNPQSILTSGFVAGIIISISGISMVPVVGNQMDQALANRGLSPLSPAAMVFFGMVSLALGVSVVGIYAVAKAQLGSGLKTAITAAVIVWFLAYFLSNTALLAYGFLPAKLVVIGIVWGFFELLLGSIVGSKLYRDAK